jgi:MYXO-CTERM domain-containing protein
MSLRAPTTAVARALGAPRRAAGARIATLAALAALTAAPRAEAFQGVGAEEDGQLVLVDGTRLRPARRTTADASRSPALAATLAADPEARWSALVDADTGVPHRLYGRGHAAPGAIQSPARAEAHARRFLESWLPALAPGAKLDDFVLVSNQLDDGIRTLGFEQWHDGLRVIGGQVSFRIKNDRLFAVGSQAFPVPARGLDPRGPLPAVTERDAIAKARAWAEARGASVASARVDGDAAILTAIGLGGEPIARRVLPVRVDTSAPVRRWTVWVDRTTGAPFAARQELRFFGSQLLVDVPVRRPTGARNDVPAPLANLTVNGRSTTTDATGNFTFTGASASVVARTVGPLVNVISADNTNARVEFTATASSTFVWSEARSETLDAQLVTFAASHVVKGHVRTVAPTLRFVDRQLEATVNIADTCNAFSDGVTINFFRASRQCENTGRLPDVVFHEYGHAVHLNGIIRGVGDFDGPLSEGISDYLAADITRDPGMGRGFFYNNAALRELDPPNEEARWPEDISDVPHTTGLIFAQSLWDLRKSLTTKLGADAAEARVRRLWFAIIQRASDLPSSYVEALAADDDDGDLANGTPNLCEINAAFALHGLATPTDVGPRIDVPRVLGNTVAVGVSGEAQCAGLAIASVELSWKIRGEAGTEGRSTLASGPLPMGLNGEGFVGQLPAARPGQVQQYKVEIRMSNGETRAFPDNAADPFYERFIGEVKPLYCTDFESVDPETEGWTHRLVAGRAREGADDWQWGRPQGTPGSNDPASARSGTRVIGNDLGGGNFNGTYQPGITNEMTSPRVDTTGYTNVRLQYWRWLHVEDGSYDVASVRANGAQVWSNLATGASTHHTDREWRFHDVDLSQQAASGAVQVSFRVQSDQGLEFGGWTVDDVCIVAYEGTAQPACGNGALEGTEQCDDGNQDDGDACRNDCTTPPMAICGDGTVAPGEACDDGNQDDTDACKSDCTANAPARCGDGVVQSGEQCDDANAAAGDGCSASCLTETKPTEEPRTLAEADPGCGCSTADPSPARGLEALAALGLVTLFRRRRRR